MKTTQVIPLRFSTTDTTSVSAILRIPELPEACLVLAHGAGAGMNHPFIADLATALSERGVATLRYQFPFMEEGSKRVDNPQVAHTTVRAAVQEAARRLPEVPIFAGGKSFGGRMTSQAQAEEALPDVRGLVFVGFPLHGANKPSAERAKHLAEVAITMLFLQGTRDALAELSLMKSTVETLGPRARMHIVEGADHSFHVLVKSGRKDADVLQELADRSAQWMAEEIGRDLL
jgi:uncharacterized protein